MKLFILLAAVSFFTSSSSDCGKKNKDPKYQGRLEIKGICSNYTIALVSGDLDTSLYEKQWTDEMTGKSHQNVFALGNPCDFPANINEGDTFYFSIDSSPLKDCMVCEAWYPKPKKAIAIKVEPE